LRGDKVIAVKKGAVYFGPLRNEKEEEKKSSEEIVFVQHDKLCALNGLHYLTVVKVSYRQIRETIKGYL